MNNTKTKIKSFIQYSAFSILLFTIQANIFAVPAYPNLITFTQPNGDTLMVRILGDERIHWHESLDGYTLLFNQDGFLTYAQLDENGNIQPSGFIASNVVLRNIVTNSFLRTIEKNLFYSDVQKQIILKIWEIEDNTPMRGDRAVTGTYKTLCAFVQFPNKAFIKSMSQFDGLMNQLGYTLNGTGSVRDFFKESSYDKFDLEITLCGIYTAPQNEEYYAGTPGDGTLRARELARWAAQQIAAEPTINFADYDSDNNGVVDGFHFIFAGVGQETGTCNTCIWSHKWSFSPAVTKNGKSISVYSCSPELYTGTTLSTIGVIVHEMTHAFGAPDFYDTNYNDYGDGLYDGTGKWDVMANGSWNGSPSGNRPPHHNAYTKTQFGWVNPVVINESKTITNMPNWAENPVAYKINTGNGTEHYLLENRQKIKFDANIPGEGLIIYHVHKNIESAGNCINCTHPQMMYPVCASSTTPIPGPGTASTQYGNINSAGCPFPGSSGKTSFNGTSTPRMFYWNNTVISDKPISNITQNPSGTIYFDFMGGASSFVSVDTIIFTMSFTTNVGTPLTLSGTVEPDDASNQDIEWEVISDGGTGASIVGDIFTATAKGTATLRATIVDGLETDEDYIQDFQINILGVDEFEIILLVEPLGVATALGEGIYSYDTPLEVSITAIHDDCYEFDNWTDESGVVVSPNPDYFFIVKESRTLSANFKPYSYEIVLLANQLTPMGGTVTGGGYHDCADVITVKAIPDPGYEFVNWTENTIPISGEDTVYTFTVNKPRLLTANFAPLTFKIVSFSNPSMGGTTSCSDTCAYLPNLSEIVVATANPCYEFIRWTDEYGTEIWSNAEYPITATENRILIADFAKKSCQLSVVAEPSSFGNVVGNGIFICGNTAQVIATPTTSSYKFINWTIGGVEVSQNASFEYQIKDVNCPTDTLIAHFSTYTFELFTNSNPLEGTTSGDGIFPEGSDVTVTATPIGCYVFLNWTDIYGNEVSSENPFTFALDKDSTLNANFEFNEFKEFVVTVNYDPTEGTITGDGTYFCNDSVTLVVIPTNCYTFLNWTNSSGSVVAHNNQISFNINKDTLLFANFEVLEYEVTTNSDPLKGTATGAGPYNCNSNATVIASSTDCYTFLNWTDSSETVVSTDNPYTFTVVQNTTLTANYTIKTCTVSTFSNPVGSCTITGSGSYNCGSSVTVTATSLDCYSFVNWTDGTGAIVSTFNPCTLTVLKDTTLTANFTILGVNNFEVITISDPLEGITTGQGNYGCGEYVTVEAIPENCFQFVKWTNGIGDVISTENPYSFYIDNNYILTAHFETIEFQVTTTSSPLGIETSGASYYMCGDTIEVSTSTTNSCYNFAYWEENGVPVCTTATYSFVVTENHDLVAIYDIVQYNIAISADPQGGGNFTGDGYQNCGKNHTITAIPNPCYVFVCWTEDGDTITTTPNYSFIVEEPREFVAHFLQKTFNITTTVNMPGSAETDGDEEDVPCGEERMVIAYPKLGYVFQNWTTINGIWISDSISYTFTVTEDNDLMANFIYVDFKINLIRSPYEGGQANYSGYYPLGMELTVQAIPNPEFEFVNWTEVIDDDTVIVETIPNYNFTVDRDRTLTAHFDTARLTIYTMPDPWYAGNTFGDTINAKYGSWITVTAVPEPHFTFKHWTINNIWVSDSAVYTFPVQQSCTLVAHFKIEEYHIILKKNPSIGGEVEGGEYNLAFGDSILVKAKPFACYNFENWTHEDGSVASTLMNYPFTVLKSDTLTANFIRKGYDILVSASPSVGGTVEQNYENVPCDTVITLYAHSNEDYKFLYWTEFGNESPIHPDSIYEFPVTESVHYVAHFTKKKFNVILSKIPENGGSISESGYNILYGTPFTASAEPAELFTFGGWWENNTTLKSMSFNWTFNVTESRNYTARFIKNFFSITTEPFPEEGGTTEGDVENVSIGTEVTVKAHSKPGYFFECWKENNVVIDDAEAEYTFEIERDRNLVAHFGIDPRRFNITTSANPDTCGSAYGDGYNLLFNTDTLVWAKPFEHYDFVKWTDENGDSVTINNPYKFKVTKTDHFTAHFAPKKYNIVVTATGGGQATGGGTNILYMTEATVKAKPNTGNVFIGWFENDIFINKIDDWTFLVTHSQELEARFELKKLSVTLISEPGTGGTLTGDGNYDFGQLVTINAEENQFYSFDYWTDEAGQKFWSKQHKFTITDNRTFTAHFSAVTSKITLISMPYDAGILTGGGDHPQGKTITVSAQPNKCYTFVNWTENDVVQDTTLNYTFTVGENDRILMANFTKNHINVIATTNPPEGGAVYGGGENLPCGGLVTLTAETSPNYLFVNWTINGEVVFEDPVFPFTYTESCEIKANFTLMTYNITVIANPLSMGSVSGGGEIHYGTSHTVNATVKQGYHFINWTENGTEVHTYPDYNFVVTKDRTLVANFEETFYNVLAIPNDSLYGTTIGSGKYRPNELATLVATPATGYQFAGWSRNDTIIATNNIFEFYANKDITLIAIFYGLEFDDYVVTLWDNTFLLDKKKLTSEGYEITGCRWFKNAKQEMFTNTIDEYSYSAGPKLKDRLELDPTFYYFQLVTRKGLILYSTKKVLFEYQNEPAPANNNLFVYPNPATYGSTFTVENAIKGTLIQVYNQYGVCVKTLTTTETTVTLSLNLPAGIYLIKNENKETKIIIIR
jgi:M6 family metalloprotease-like protein